MKVMSLTILEPVLKSREEPVVLYYRSELHVRSHSSGSWRHFYAGFRTIPSEYEAKKDDPAFYEWIISTLIGELTYQLSQEIKTQVGIMFNGHQPPLPSEVDNIINCGTIVLPVEDELDLTVLEGMKHEIAGT